MEQHFTDEDVVYGVLGVVVEDEGESDYKTKKYDQVTSITSMC